MTAHGWGRLREQGMPRKFQAVIVCGHVMDMAVGTITCASTGLSFVFSPCLSRCNSSRGWMRGGDHITTANVRRGSRNAAPPTSLVQEMPPCGVSFSEPVTTVLINKNGIRTCPGRAPVGPRTCPGRASIRPSCAGPKPNRRSRHSGTTVRRAAGRRMAVGIGSAVHPTDRSSSVTGPAHVCRCP